MSTSWTIAIDWDRNGEFSGEHDDITQRVLLAEWFVGMQRPYQLTADGSTLVIRVNDKDRRFSPENSAGPLTGKLVPGRYHRHRRDAIPQGHRNQDRAAREPAQRPHHRHPDQRGHLPARAGGCLGSWRRARRRIGARANQRSCGITVIR